MFKQIIGKIKNQEWFKIIFRSWNIRDYKWVFLLYPLGFYGIHLLLKITKSSMLSISESADLELKFVTYFSIIIVFLIFHYCMRGLLFIFNKIIPKFIVKRN